MSETENKIEPEVASITPEEKNAKPSQLALYSALLSLVLIVVCVAGALYFYKINQALIDSHQQQLNSLSEKLNVDKSALLKQSKEMKSTLDTQIEQVTLQLQETNNDSKIIKTDIQSLQRSFAETNIRHPNDWILSEVEYLVALAGRKIWLEKDIKSAISLLMAADQRVVELNDASLSPLRSALLEDVNQLEALPKRDTDGVILMLSSLERRVKTLRSNSLTVPDANEKVDNEISTDINEWDTNLIKSWNVFINSFITVNKRDDKVEALLSPEQSWYLQENLRNNLAKAEFAIYREQQDVYDLALENIEALLTNYYDLQDNNTKHFNQSIQRLSKRKIALKYPEQLKSAPLLERIVEQRLEKSLASSSLK